MSTSSFLAIRPIVFILVATFCMAAQDVIVKLVSSDMPLWQVFVLRSVLALLVLMALGRAQWRALRCDRAELIWAALRSLLIVAMYVAFYAALAFVDLGLVAAAYYTGPIFILILSALFLSERLLPLQIVAIGVAFVGVLVLLRPGTGQLDALLLVPILSAICYASAMVLTKAKIAQSSAFLLSIVLNLAFITVGGLMSVILLMLELSGDQIAAHPFLLTGWEPLDLRMIWVLSILAAITVVIHLALARAYQTGSPPLVATFDYAYLIFACLLGYLVLGERLDALAFVGIALIVGAGLLSVRARLGLARAG